MFKAHKAIKTDNRIRIGLFQSEWHSRSVFKCCDGSDAVLQFKHCSLPVSTCCRHLSDTQYYTDASHKISSLHHTNSSELSNEMKIKPHN